MEFMVGSDRSNGIGVCMTDADVGSLSDGELVERMALLGRERSRVEALLAEAAAEMHRRDGGRATAAMMRERLNVSARQATADTELAASLGPFPATMEAGGLGRSLRVMPG